MFPCKALGGRLGAGGDISRGSDLSLDILANNFKMLVETDLIILVEGGSSCSRRRPVIAGLRGNRRM